MSDTQYTPSSTTSIHETSTRKASKMVVTKYKAAAVTSEPSWFDLEGGVRKTIDFINEAGQAGCKLVAFPEVCKYPLSLY
jgi:hypothetical protein